MIGNPSASSYIFERHCLSGVDVVATTLQSYSSILRARNRHWTSLMLFLCWALPCVLGQRSWQISRVLAHNEARKGLTRCGFGLPFGKFSAAAAKESSLGEERPVISLANLSVFVCLRMFLLFWVILIVFCLAAIWSFTLHFAAQAVLVASARKGFGAFRGASEAMAPMAVWVVLLSL